MAEAQEKDAYEISVEADKKAYADEIAKEVAEQRALNEQQKAAVEAARKQREPEWEALKKRQAEYEAVPTPTLGKPPPPPNTQEMLKPTSLQKTLGMAGVFALLSVGLAKGQAIYGLKALGGFMEGAHAGNLEQAGAALKDFTNNMEYVRATNEYALAQYNSIIGNKKYSLEVQDRMFRQKALEMDDQLSIQTHEQGRMNAVHVRLRDLAKMNYEFDKELNRHRQIENQLANYRLKAGGAAGGANALSVLGIPMSEIPPLPAGQERNEAFLAMLPKPLADIIRDMDSGLLPVSGFGGFAVKDRNEYLKAASIYHPGSSASQKYIVHTKALQEGTPGGPVGRNELAINTLAEHIDQWSESMKRLNNSQLQRWNTSRNRLKTEFGDPALQEAQVPAGIAAAELARIVKGGTAAPTEQEIAYWEGVFNTSSSPEQVKRVIWSALEASGGRLVSIERAYRQQGIERHVLTREARQLLLKHKPKDRPTPEWLKAPGEKPSTPGGKRKVTEDQAREMVLKYGSAAAAMKAAKEQGLEFE